MNWFTRLLPKITTSKTKGVPEGIWSKCTDCNAILYKAELEKNLEVCPKCGFHLPIVARQRLLGFLDEKKTEELGISVRPVDRLRFKDSKRYKDRLQTVQRDTGETEALVVMKGSLQGMPVVAMAFDFRFIGGSMSSGVGERFGIGVQAALHEKCPVVCFSTSGGARMQEGLFSLLQMAKTSAMLAKLASLHLPYISVLTDPTMGGVSASLATLGDVIIAEPKALIGFSGPRVIEQTIREVLPEGFQRSEFLLEHGAIDMILDRRQLRPRIAEMLAKFQHQATG